MLESDLAATGAAKSFLDEASPEFSASMLAEVKPQQSIKQVGDSAMLCFLVEKFETSLPVLCVLLAGTSQENSPEQWKQEKTQENATSHGDLRSQWKIQRRDIF